MTGKFQTWDRGDRWFCGREPRRGAMTSDGLLYGKRSAQGGHTRAARAFATHFRPSERRRRDAAPDHDEVVDAFAGIGLSALEMAQCHRNGRTMVSMWSAATSVPSGWFDRCVLRIVSAA